MTLGGVVGEVHLEGLTREWCLLLAAMQAYHVGKATLYGCGRFHLPQVAPLHDEPFTPGGHLLERCTQPTVLERARVHVCAHSNMVIEPSDLESLGESLRQGRYRASDLLGFLMPKQDGGWHPLAVPIALDRVAQLAAIEVLSPVVDSLLSDCSYAYRKGFSCQGSARAIRKAYEDGYLYTLDVDLESFFEIVDWRRLFARLDALFPFEPLVAVLRQWARTGALPGRAARAATRSASGLADRATLGKFLPRRIR